jgi:hypothetical protein
LVLEVRRTTFWQQMLRNLLLVFTNGFGIPFQRAIKHFI